MVTSSTLETPRARSGSRRAALAVCVLVLLALAVVLGVPRLWPRVQAATPLEAVDHYVSARQSGDVRAMSAILDGQAESRESRLHAVDGHPVHVSQVSLVQEPISSVLYDLTVVTTDGAEHLLVLPRSGRDPSLPLDWSVSVAP